LVLIDVVGLLCCASILIRSIRVTRVQISWFEHFSGVENIERNAILSADTPRRFDVGRSKCVVPLCRSAVLITVLDSYEQRRVVTSRYRTQAPLSDPRSKGMFSFPRRAQGAVAIRDHGPILWRTSSIGGRMLETSLPSSTTGIFEPVRPELASTQTRDFCAVWKEKP
jgi:hypothetical protein